MGSIVFAHRDNHKTVAGIAIESMVPLMSVSFPDDGDGFRIIIRIHPHGSCSRKNPQRLANHARTEILIIKGMESLLADPDERLDSLFSLYDSYYGR